MNKRLRYIWSLNALQRHGTGQLSSVIGDDQYIAVSLVRPDQFTKNIDAHIFQQSRTREKLHWLFLIPEVDAVLCASRTHLRCRMEIYRYRRPIKGFP